MRGIILAGGRGTRLYPTTQVVSKHLLPLYDKPLIYYPLSTLMLAGIRDILLISTSEHVPLYRRLLGDGSRLGMRFEYAVQYQPGGLAEALILGADFIGDDRVSLILGDNFFYGADMAHILQQAMGRREGATIFGYPVKDPGAFGVVAFNEARQVTSLEEKPRRPRSNYAVPGLYFYDNDVVGIARAVEPSERGELEITSVNREYLRRGRLNVQLLGSDVTWVDAGTPAELHRAAGFVEAMQRQGRYIACVEETAWRSGFISRAQLAELGRELIMTEYGRYILACAGEEAPGI